MCAVQLSPSMTIITTLGLAGEAAVTAATTLKATVARHSAVIKPDIGNWMTLAGAVVTTRRRPDSVAATSHMHRYISL